MATDRRFCRFNKLRDTPFGMPEVPEGGLCLSAFLVISEPGHPERVLMGRLDPSAPWDHLGALDPSRTAAHGAGWMLPSSHLMVNEAPQQAAQRIAREQLEREDLALGEPRVVSEVYTPRRFPDLPQHWDLEFIFRCDWPQGLAPKAKAWRELQFVDLSRTSRSQIARSHEEILENLGLRFASP